MASSVSAVRPPVSTRGRRAVVTGFFILSLAVGASILFRDSVSGQLVSFTGVLAGVNVIAIGVRIANDPAPTSLVPAVLAGVGALPPSLLRRNLAIVGLLMASYAVTVTAAEGEAVPGLCFNMLVLLLLGVSLINEGIRGRGA